MKIEELLKIIPCYYKGKKIVGWGKRKGVDKVESVIVEVRKGKDIRVPIYQIKKKDLKIRRAK